MAEPSGARGAPNELVVAALVAAAALPLGRLFEEGPWSVVLSSMGVSLAVSWVSRKLRLQPVVAFAVSAFALLWWVSVVFYGDTLWGPFPSAETIEHIGTAIGSGTQQAIERAAPVPLTTELKLFVAAGVWTITWLVEASLLWIGNPLLAIACAVPLFVTPGTIAPGERQGFTLGLFVIAAGATLARGHREEVSRVRPAGGPSGRLGWRPGSLAFLLGGAGFAAIAIAPLLPGYGAPPGLEGSGGGQLGTRIELDPFVAIKPTLRNDDEQVLFRVSADRPTYYRLTALEVFDGEGWRPGPRRARLVRDGTIEPETQAASVPVVQTVTLAALAGRWLPAAYDPIGIDAPLDVAIEEPTRALRVREPLGYATTYSVVSGVPSPSPELLDRPVEYDRAALERWLRLPADSPPSLERIARQIVGRARTPYRQAVALQDHLRRFEYDEDVADGHSFDTIEEFLTDTKRGYCEQFAGSMAVLARTLGIPARVAIGFAYGDVQGDTYVVTTRHAHAWVELYFPQAGWVLFEPTPRSGLTTPPEYTDPPEQEGETEPTEQPTASPTEDTPDGGRAPEDDTGTGDAADAAGGPAWRRPLVVAVGALLLAGVAIALLQARRSALIRKAGTPSEFVRLSYADFLAWCAAAGLPRRPGETPREHLARLRSAGAPEEQASALSALVDEALWAPPNGLDVGAFETSAASVRGALTAGLSRPRKLLIAAGWGRTRPWA